MHLINSDLPIYLQIVKKLEYDIVSERLIPGEKLLSIRELALQYQVNPNTMFRALSELEERKLIVTERTNGKYVVDDLSIINEFKDELIKQDTNTYINKLKHLKISREKAKALIDDLWEVNNES